MIRRYYRDGYILLVLLALTFIGALLVYRLPTQIELNLGAGTEGVYLEGFHAAEISGNFDYRWTQEQSQVRLHGISWGRPLWLQVQIAAQWATDGEPVDATVSLDDQFLGHVQVRPLSPDHVKPDVYTFAIPPRFSWTGDLVVELRSPTFTPGGEDTRKLGLVADQITVVYGKGWGWPPLLPTMMLAAIVLVGYGGVRLAGWGKGVALACAGGLLLALCMLLVYERLWVTPHLPAFAGTVAIGVGLLLLARQLVGGERVDHSGALVLLVVFAPLFLWWQFALIPIVLNRRDFSILALPVATAILYLGVPLLWRRRGERRKGRLDALFIGTVLVLTLIHALLFYVWVFSKDYATDFHALFDGVRSLFVSKGPLYDLDKIERNHFGAIYKYPPFFSLFMLPLAWLDFVPALQLWRGLSLVLLAVTGWLLAREYRFGRDPWLWTGLVFVLLNWRPIGDTVAYGQVDLLLFVPMVGALLALRRRKSWLAGLLLALATMLKLYPAFLALFFLLRREWRALFFFGLALVLLVGLSVAVLGWDVHVTYLRDVMPHSGGGTPWVENQTFNGFFNRLFTDRISLTPETSPWADRAALFVSSVLVLVTSGLVFFSKGESGRYDLGFALLMVTMLLILPAAWIHYEMILVLPLILVLVQAREGIGFREMALVGLAFGLLCFGNAWSVYEREVFGRFWQLLLSYKVYGMLFLWLGLALLLWEYDLALLWERVRRRRGSRPS